MLNCAYHFNTAPAQLQISHLTRPVTWLYQGRVCLGKTTYLFRAAAAAAAAVEELSLSLSRHSSGRGNLSATSDCNL